MTIFCLPLTTFPVCSSGFPGSLIWPFAPRSLNHATHFSICFCICSGDADVSLPRNRYVNSLIVFPLKAGISNTIGFDGHGGGSDRCPPQPGHFHSRPSPSALWLISELHDVRGAFCRAEPQFRPLAFAEEQLAATTKAR